MSYYPPQPPQYNPPAGYPTGPMGTPAPVPYQQQKPSAHIECTKDESVHLPGETIIDIWSPYSKCGHITGGIEFHGGTLKVPCNGVFVVYCQVWFNPSPETGRYLVKKNGDHILVGQSVHGSNTEGPVSVHGCFVLNQGDVIHVELSKPHRVWNGPGHTYFGLHMI